MSNANEVIRNTGGFIWQDASYAYIYDGAEYTPHYVYIFDGASWNLYDIYIHDGTSWQLVQD